MRSADFSKAPRIAQAGAMFTGATRYNGIPAWITLSWTWHKLVKRMKAMPGYCWHTVYYEPPFTLGTIAYFDTRDDLLRIARSPEHRKLMQWITDGTKNAKGGYIRLWVAEPDGYTNGIWRAEGNVMAHIETYSPIRGDQGPQRVDDATSEIV
ncbi:MAG: DUF4188 domain-containing protein [Tetrasphaera sp.]|nr:DUF4188 domain-containing protein [Tetrasphaera sp.]